MTVLARFISVLIISPGSSLFIAVNVLKILTFCEQQSEPSRLQQANSVTEVNKRLHGVGCHVMPD